MLGCQAARWASVQTKGAAGRALVKQKTPPAASLCPRSWALNSVSSRRSSPEPATCLISYLPGAASPSFLHGPCPLSAVMPTRLTCWLHATRVHGGGGGGGGGRGLPGARCAVSPKQPCDVTVPRGSLPTIKPLEPWSHKATRLNFEVRSLDCDYPFLWLAGSERQRLASCGGYACADQGALSGIGKAADGGVWRVPGTG